MSINKTIVVKPGFNSDSYVTGGTIDNNQIVLKLNNGKQDVSISLDSIITEDSYVTGATLDDKRITLKLNNNKQNVTVDLDYFTPEDSGNGEKFLSDNGDYKPVNAIIVKTTSGNTQSDIDELYNRTGLSFPLEYTYNSTGSTPSNREFTFNDINLSAATEVYLSNKSRRGIQIDNFLKFILNDSIGDRFYIQRRNNSNRYFIYEIVGTPTFGTFTTIPISFIEGNGPFNNGNNCIMIKN